MLPRLIVRVLQIVCAALPERARRIAARSLSGIQFRVAVSRRRAVFANLDQIASAGHADLADAGVRHRTARRMFESFTLAWIESFSRRPLRGPRFRFQGAEILYRALAGGRGAVIAAPHLGSWDVAGAALVELGFDVHAVAGIQLHPTLSAAFLAEQERRGIRIHTPAEGFGGLVEALRRGALVVLLADGDVFSRALPTPFFGRRVLFPSGPAVLSRRARVPILHAHAARDPQGGNRLCFVGVDAPDFSLRIAEDVRRLTSLVARQEERTIAAHVSQWGIFRPVWSGDLA